MGQRRLYCTLSLILEALARNQRKDVDILNRGPFYKTYLIYEKLEVSLYVVIKLQSLGLHWNLYFEMKSGNMDTCRKLMCFLTISYRVLERKKKVVWLFYMFSRASAVSSLWTSAFLSLVCLYFALRRQVQDDVDKLTLLGKKGWRFLVSLIDVQWGEGWGECYRVLFVD